jgi:YgiT-type zinc finger domain-containing protein
MNRPRKCGSCQSRLVYTTVEHPYWHDNVLVALVHNVPSWVCELCGFRYFEPAVLSTLEHLVQDYIKLGKTFPIPTTPYRAVAVPVLN